jgi:uncharacterized cupin superfamily protein
MTQDRRHPHIVNRDEVQPYEEKQGQHHYLGRMLGRAAGNQQIGATVTELPPGAIGFPFHYHCANEEAVYVISGTGTLRIGDARVAVRPGDWIAFPVGPETAHQFINDGTAREPLVYLCVSTLHKCEVVGYPDSNKIMASAGPAFDKRWIRQLWPKGETLDYWDGEPKSK